MYRPGNESSHPPQNERRIRHKTYRGKNGQDRNCHQYFHRADSSKFYLNDLHTISTRFKYYPPTNTSGSTWTKRKKPRTRRSRSSKKAQLPWTYFWSFEKPILHSMWPHFPTSRSIFRSLHRWQPFLRQTTDKDECSLKTPSLLIRLS